MYVCYTIKPCCYRPTTTTISTTGKLTAADNNSRNRSGDKMAGTFLDGIYFSKSKRNDQVQVGSRSNHMPLVLRKRLLWNNIVHDNNAYVARVEIIKIYNSWSSCISLYIYIKKNKNWKTQYIVTYQLKRICGTNIEQCSIRKKKHTQCDIRRNIVSPENLCTKFVIEKCSENRDDKISPILEKRTSLYVYVGTRVKVTEFSDGWYFLTAKTD